MTPVADLSMAEMVRRACAEVGAPCSTVRDHPDDEGRATVRWATIQRSPELWKAAMLAMLATHGPTFRVKCPRHAAVGAPCDRVTVAEALLDPDVHCGLNPEKGGGSL